MEKRVQVVDGVIVVSVIIPLSKEESEKFENTSLRRKISNLAKDFHVDWAIEVNDNGTTASCVSRTYDIVVGNDELCNLEIDAVNFCSAVESLESNPTPKDDVDLKKEIEFVKEVLADLKSGNVLAAALITPIVDEHVGIALGHIGSITLEKMCETYLEKYDKKKQSTKSTAS